MEMLDISTEKNTETGFTILSMLVTMALLAIMAFVATSSIKGLINPLEDASYEVSHYLRLVRSRAISQTLSITVSPSSTSELSAVSSDSCGSETTEPVSSLILELPDGAYFSETDWSICFTQRGLASTYTTFDLAGDNERTRTVAVALGGGVQIQ